MRDIFVNKTAFYKEVADLLEAVFDNISWTKTWADDVLKTEWVDPSIKKKIASIKYDNEKAIEGFQKIYAILQEGRCSRVQTKRNHEFKCVERLSVITGGLYISPTATTHMGLSDKFQKFLEDKKNQGEPRAKGGLGSDKPDTLQTV